ncbi:helix-turn-helix domain-containing protein [Methylobacterium sp. J-030]|uniref:helix-turn-helix domain-containing protein n=1 Tax=Methylobacterium sp. J-030 TaxID=2836627 RepID=UPI001FBBD09D|nr:helix-turn-helix domain-containing protein [Methylobacterium sp. J-030]MCJ2067987.1 helix-turn-helix domain-containing protein [Methylobacterium sp. J-030]
MTTSQIPSLSETTHPDAEIPNDCLVYFQDRLRSRLYDLVIGEFEQARIDGLTQAKLARRLGKKPEQIHKWLSSPGNWTLNTVSNLLLGISSTELTMGCDRVFIAPTLNDLETPGSELAVDQRKSNDNFGTNYSSGNIEGYYYPSQSVQVGDMINVLATVIKSGGE